MITRLFALNMSYGFFVESRAKRQITGLFGQYVPPELADEMSKDPDAFSMDGESRELSVLFADVRGFTTLSEGLEGTTKQYGVNMIVGEATRAAVPEAVFRELDKVKVKGKDAPIAIFEPIGLSNEIEKAVQDELKLWGQVLRLYRVRDWDMAELQLINLVKVAPDRGL